MHTQPARRWVGKKKQWRNVYWWLSAGCKPPLLNILQAVKNHLDPPRDWAGRVWIDVVLHGDWRGGEERKGWKRKEGWEERAWWKMWGEDGCHCQIFCKKLPIFSLNMVKYIFWNPTNWGELDKENNIEPLEYSNSLLIKIQLEFMGFEQQIT